MAAGRAALVPLLAGALVLLGLLEVGPGGAPDSARTIVLDALTEPTPRYLPVEWQSHDEHAARLGGDCAACHHAVAGEAAAERRCSNCHDRADAAIDLKEASHRSCRACHQREVGRDPASRAPVDCLACHRQRR